MVLVVILGRTGRTEFNFPATIAALVVNVALNLALVPPLGIVGAGLALVASYLVVVALMYGFTQRLFPVPYEWGRLARVVARLGRAWSALGELLMPTDGASASLGRAVALARLPAGPARRRLLHRRGAPLAGAACATPASCVAELCARSRRSRPRSTARSPRPTRPSASTRTPASRPARCGPARRQSLVASRPAEERLAGVGPVDARRAGRGGRWPRARAGA